MFRQNFHEFTSYTMLISSIMIICVGLYLIYSAIKNKNDKLNDEKIDNTKSKYTIAFSVGIVPCPGVMTIVLFCVMLKQFTLGILCFRIYFVIGVLSSGFFGTESLGTSIRC